MRKLLVMIVLAMLACCRPEYVNTKYKYAPGDKILLKTGDTAVVVEHHWMTRQHVKGHWVTPRYIVRVGYIKKAHHTDSLLEGHRVRESEPTKFDVYEHEIEKKIK